MGVDVLGNLLGTVHRIIALMGDYLFLFQSFVLHLILARQISFDHFDHSLSSSSRHLDIFTLKSLSEV